MTRLRALTTRAMWLFAMIAPLYAVAQDIPSIESGRINVGGTVTRVVLHAPFTAPVVVCTVHATHNDVPVVVRVANVTASSFDLRLQNPANAPVVADWVSYLVVEAGSWTVDGLAIDAWTYQSTLTDHDGMWAGQVQQYLQDHAQPVVLGQVMSSNDPDWSAFWCQGALLADAPSALNLRAGKMVGEDPRATRVTETIGIIVLEHTVGGTLGGVACEARVGPDTILGSGGAPPTPYAFETAFDTAPEVVLATMAGVDGEVGGWARVDGTSATQLFLSIDEDQLRDDERTHTSEQVGYVALAHGVTLAMAEGTDCSTDDACDDGVPCTVDRCIAGVCQHAAVDELCDNGLFCDGIEYCDALGGCMAGQPPCANGCNEAAGRCAGCATDADCIDDLFCNGIESCVAGECVAGFSPCAPGYCLEPYDICGLCYTSFDCDDGLFCNGYEICFLGYCQAVSTPCPGPCDEDLDDCVTCLADADCDDGLVCNGAEMCDAGSCHPGTPPDCTDAHACTVDSCSEALGGCVNAPDHAACDDGLYCDGSESCDPLFGCIPGASPCTSQCNEEADTCVECAADADCTDDLFCNGSEACVDGLCLTGNAPACDDGIACTIDTCNEAARSCSHQPDHGACDDGLFCTGIETCDPTLGCQAAAGPCAGLCDDALDACVDCLTDADCDDGLFCSGIERCVAGSCLDGQPIDCTDEHPCTITACDEATEGCVVAPDDTVCDNGLFCDGQEHCDADLGCVAGDPPCPAQCNDVTDTCSECLTAADCDDGAWCTGTESCVDGACVPGTSPTCDDGLACTVDGCDEATAACVFTPLDTLCSDGLFCNGSERCSAEAGCIAGIPPCAELCDDTLDACVACLDDAHCDDGLPCNGVSTCVAGACVTGPPIVCDDGLACTIDTCVAQTGACLFTPDDTRCDNGLFCDGAETCDLASGCVAGAPPCAAACDEAADACVACLHSGDCDDGLFCNGAEACVAGTCLGGVEIDCGDAYDCTLDSCNEDIDACVHVPDHGACDNGLYCDGTEQCALDAGCVAGMPPCPAACDDQTDQCIECLTAADCDDGLVCTGVEACIDGHCVAGNPPACTDGIACTADSCDEQLGGCVHTPLDTLCDNNLFCDGAETCHPQLGCVAGEAPCSTYCDDTANACVACTTAAHCSDGLYCNGAEQCVGGQCLPGDAPNCSDGIACSDDWCNEALDECQHQLMHGACNDGLFCNGVELCSPTGCTAGMPPCTGPCDEAADRCVECVADTDCADDLTCNGAERCTDGVCVPGAPPECDDGVACTVDGCIEPGGCVHFADAAACDNGVFCDGPEMCLPDVGCVAGPTPCPGACDEESATCVGCARARDCDDGLFCNGREQCVDGVCLPGEPRCPGFCLEGADHCGTCTVDAHCDDGIACNGFEVCYFGACVQFAAPPCDDGIACTIDRCDATTGGCVYEPAHDLCDNGLFCDGPELCSTSVGCVAGPPPCGGPCNEASDTCIAQCVTAADCADGLYCNGVEACVGGLCLPGSVPLCDDGVACTVDTCNESTDACDHQPDHDPCDNGVFCDGAEVCVAGSGCAPGAPPCTGPCLEDLEICAACATDADCADDLFCNGEEMCVGGLCTSGGAPCAADLVCDEAVDLCVGGTTAGSVHSLTLYNALTDEPVPAYDPLFDGAILNVDGLPPLAIAANTIPPVGSIVFEVRQDGSLIYSHTENVAPYALFGDDPVGDYNPWPGGGPEPGHQYDISVAAYSDPNGGGTPGMPVVIGFSAAGGCQTDAACDDGLFCNGTEQCVAGTCQAGVAPCAGLACNEASRQCAAAQGVISLRLIDATSDEPVPAHDPLVDGATLNVGALGPVAVQGVTVPATVGSVSFQLRRDGVLEWQRTENTPPYALFGDTAGDYDAWPGGGPQAGSTYSITATSYSESNAGGTADPPLTVTIDVVDTCSGPGECDDGLYCNGVESCVDGACLSAPAPCAAGQVCNESTQRCTDPVPQTLYVDDDGPAQPGYDPTAPPGAFNHPFASAQAAADAAIPGDTVLFRSGTYSSGSTAQAVTVMSVTTSGLPGLPITFAAAPGEAVVFSGQNGLSNTLVDIGAAYIDITGIELTGARRAAMQIAGASAHHINVRECHAHHNDHDGNWIGAAFRTLGPVSDILFEACLSHNNAGGFQIRESPTQTSATAAVPPVAGNTGFVDDLPEAQWDAWPGWTAIAARRVTLRRCIAFDNQLIDEHSDGFGLRYGIECTMEDCIAFRNSDEGADLLGATRCIARGNIMFDNDPANTVNGDGNGIKIGVRGGLDCLAYDNIVFDNPRGGIDMADTERPVVFNNTVFNNDVWFGIWFEGGRSSTGATVFNNLCAQHTKGNIGFNAGVALALYDHNILSGPNTHNWARPVGPASLVNTDPQFLAPGLAIDTAFPTGLSIAERAAFIRDQVHAKLGLQASSPAIDAGMSWPAVEHPFNGTAPDVGAIEYE